MDIDEFIDKIEVSYLESALEKLAATPKDLVTVYLSAKEYQRAKLIRSNYIPENQEEKSITIEIIDGAKKGGE